MRDALGRDPHEYGDVSDGQSLTAKDRRRTTGRLGIRLPGLLGGPGGILVCGDGLLGGRTTGEMWMSSTGTPSILQMSRTMLSTWSRRRAWVYLIPAPVANSMAHHPPLRMAVTSIALLTLRLLLV